MSIKSTLLILALLLAGCSRNPMEKKPITLDELMIEVKAPSREIAYTNKQAGYFYTETNGDLRTGWQGWHIMSTKMMDDYILTIDGKPLIKKEARLARVFPHQLIRVYPDEVLETVTLLDSIDALVVELDGTKGKDLTVAPLFGDSHLSGDYVTRLEENVLLIAKSRHLRRTAKENYPVWIGLTAALTTSNSRARFDSLNFGARFSPAQFSAEISNSSAAMILVAGDSASQVVSAAHEVAASYRQLIQKRKDRMERLLNRSYLRTDNERFTKAINWAKISMDALIMNQMKKGIYAGLPWFDDYWGRDSYISLTGATLVTGDFAVAKQILQSFSDWQDRNAGSPTFGRIPNLVTTNSIVYNTADGTPRFSIALNDYIKYSNDTAFAREMYPTMYVAIEGAISNHTDMHGFLMHGDAETWMDAVGPDGAWSPRGNRANDIQALWYRQLQVGVWLATLEGDRQTVVRWDGYAQTLISSFNRYFVNGDSGFVYDHLMPDGTPDRQMRPNQLFTLNMILDPDVKAKVFRTVTERLVYPHGVASLWQEDRNFHPYHHHEPYYVQDAAYHNGIVWTWLAGRWVDAATGYGLSDLAFTVSDNMATQMLDRGAVGTLSELLDAAPHPGESEPRLSGAFSQAWSLAEFVRSFYQSYLGVTVDAAAPRIYLRPRLPSSIQQADFTVPVGQFCVEVHYHIEKSDGEIVLKSPSDARDVEVQLEWPFPDGAARVFMARLRPNNPVTLEINHRGVMEKTATFSQQLDTTFRKPMESVSALQGICLATPVVHPDLKALQQPTHRILTNAEVKSPSSGTSVLYEITDPVGDDKGTGSYTYPLTPNLKPGSLDITYFKVSADEKNVHFLLRFRNLSNPGWHPEYGFQLTFGAIAIDKDGIPGSGQTLVGRNARYVLNRSHAFENIIYFGGGVSVEDAKGNILAEYRPVPGDERNPLGSVDTKTVSFAIPVEILGMPKSSWRYTVLIGAQDDHGGAGIGEFRNVGFEAGEWVGGGKRKSDDPNVYDVILPRR